MQEHPGDEPITKAIACSRQVTGVSGQRTQRGLDLDAGDLARPTILDDHVDLAATSVLEVGEIDGPLGPCGLLAQLGDDEGLGQSAGSLAVAEDAGGCQAPERWFGGPARGLQ